MRAWRPPAPSQLLEGRILFTIPRDRVVSLDPYSDESTSDQLAAHDELREAGEVVYLEKYGVYASGRFDIVDQLFREWQSFEVGSGIGLVNLRKETSGFPMGARYGQTSIIESDPPWHDPLRRAASTVIGPRKLRALRPIWMAEANTLIDGLTDRDRIDGASEIAHVFPQHVFPDALGIRSKEREDLALFGAFLFNQSGPPNELSHHMEDRIPAIREWIAEHTRREALVPGGIATDIWEAGDRGEINYEQASAIVFSLLAAGIDTTVNGISAAIVSLARHPDQYERVREDPSLTRIAIDEALRVESPVTAMFRAATTDVELGGITIPAGEKIFLSIPGANRDPRRWDRPTEFDLDRDPSGHLGFGIGIHQCVGQHVARLEAESIITAIARRATSLELAGDVVMQPNNRMRIFKSIPLAVEWGADSL
jgi:cytochrome P450